MLQTQQPSPLAMLMREYLLVLAKRQGIASSRSSAAQPAKQKVAA